MCRIITDWSLWNVTFGSRFAQFNWECIFFPDPGTTDYACAVIYADVLTLFLSFPWCWCLPPLYLCPPDTETRTPSLWPCARVFMSLIWCVTMPGCCGKRYKTQWKNSMYVLYRQVWSRNLIFCSSFIIIIIIIIIKTIKMNLHHVSHVAMTF